jgi:hypothetical protein
MIILNIDLETRSERENRENYDFLEETINIVDFEEFNEFVVYCMCELNALDEKVYVLAYGGDEDGVVFVDHLTGNIIENMNTQFKHVYDEWTQQDDDYEMNIFLFACDNYNEAYNLALDMKEETGMLKWQLENEIGEEPTVANGGIVVTSLIN